MAAFRQARGKAFVAQPNGRQLRLIGTMIDGGDSRPIVQQVYTLPEAPKAQQEIQSGHTLGKLVLQVAA
jgi:NADPH:quinone reductase-like Zn-dependent oxidoreductase